MSGKRDSGDTGPLLNRKAKRQQSIDVRAGAAVFIWGSTPGSHHSMTKPVYAKGLCGVDVREVACGENRGIVLTADGDVAIWGSSEDSFHNTWPELEKISSLAITGKLITAIDCQYERNAAITANGELYIWRDSASYPPQTIETLRGRHIKQVAMGECHSLALDSEGNIHAWGNNRAGHGISLGFQAIPKVIETFLGRTVSQVSAGRSHSAVLLDDTEVFTWGWGASGQLGYLCDGLCDQPRLVETLRGQDIGQVSCGLHYTAVVTKTEGRLYTFGSNEHGQLGRLTEMDMCHTPTVVAMPGGAALIQVSCGSNHTVALSSKGQVYTWGRGNLGELGTGSLTSTSQPSMVGKLRNYYTYSVRAFGHFTVALVDRSSLPVDEVPIIDALRAALDDERYSDVTFTVENEAVHAHRVILAQRCQFFRTMFESGMRESKERVITIKNVRKEVFLLVLKYCYSDTVEVGMDHLMELYKTADQYGIRRLKDLCCQSLEQKLNVDNAGALLQEMDDHSCPALGDICMRYVVDNYVEVSENVGHGGIQAITTPSLLHKIILGVAQKQKATRQNLGMRLHLSRRSDDDDDYV